MELLRQISVSEIIAQILSFLLLVFILKAFVWKRLLNFLDERRRKIADEFKHIENSKAQIEALKTEYQKKLDLIADESKQKIKEAIGHGDKLAQEIKRNAHIESQKIIEKAKEDIKFELSAAKEELKKKIVDLTMMAAETVIQDKLTEEEDRKIVLNFINKADEI